MQSPPSSVDMKASADVKRSVDDVDEPVADVYSREAFPRFLAQGVRPDGRPLGRARRTSIGLGAIATAEGSALAKIGNTTMLAGVKLEVVEPARSQPNEGFTAVSFEMPPLCSPTIRPGKPIETASLIGEQIANAIDSAGMVNKKELCIVPGKAVWKAFVDVYCIDADGSLFDAALLATVSALSDVRIPAGVVDKDGIVCFHKTMTGSEDSPVSEFRNGDTTTFQLLDEKPSSLGFLTSEKDIDKSQVSDNHRSHEYVSDMQEPTSPISETQESNGHACRRTFQRKKLTLGPVPFSLTSAIFANRCRNRSEEELHAAAEGGAQIPANGIDNCVDPCRTEEMLADALVTVVLDHKGQLISMFKPGGLSISTPTIQDCIEAAKLRARKLQASLQKAVNKAADTREADKMEEV